jgi:hypothetical protein
VASEAFAGKIKAEIDRGLQAHEELKWIEESNEQENDNNDFWE